MSSAPFHGAGKKLDKGKPRYDLIPTRALLEFVRVLTFGVEKYEANGWRKVIGWRWRYLRAGLTHVFQYIGGQACDPETGYHHLAHALCCFFFVLDNELAIVDGVTVPDGDAPAPPDSQQPGEPHEEESKIT